MKAFLILLAVLLQGLIQAESKPQRCPRACSFLYKPVCGSNGETYANNCLLKAARDCQNIKDLYVKKNGDCDDCSSRKATGFCRAYIPRWHYDSQSDTCKQFVFGGCGGNGNNYDTKEECEQTCVKETEECPKRCPNTYDPVCASNGKTYSNKCQLQLAVGCWKEKATFMYAGECSINKEKEDECPERCPNTYDPVCGSDGRTYSNKCQLKMAVGCWKEKISYMYAGECVSNKDVCKLPKDEGKCLAADSRWYFDYASGKCKRFDYGGCLGNANNFLTLSECTSTCGPKF